jgi:hypothetical protein
MLWKYKENRMNELLKYKTKIFEKCDVKENARPLLPSEHSDKKITGGRPLTQLSRIGGLSMYSWLGAVHPNPETMRYFLYSPCYVDTTNKIIL